MQKAARTGRRGSRWISGLVAALAVLAGGAALGACSSGSGGGPAAALIAAPQPILKAQAQPDPSDDTDTTLAPSTTEAATTAPPPPGMGPGDTGPAVQALEQKLAALHYEVGPVDDTYDSDTAYGVMAFQKVMGLDRTGRATDDVVAALATATPPPPIVAQGGASRVEIDLDRQVLFLYEAGSLSKILPVSTGSGQRFCSEGYCRKAITPQGSYAIYEQRSGWETSPLGRLYNSQYFNGGIAIHGSPSVPGYPASHGCVRIPMSDAEWFPSHVTVGTPVYVAGDEGTPPPLPPDFSVTSTTAAPATAAAPGNPDSNGGSPPPISYAPTSTPPVAPTTTAPPSLLGFLAPKR